MPSTLLESQLQTLELPTADEHDVVRLEIERPATTVIREAVRALRARLGR